LDRANFHLDQNIKSEVKAGMPDSVNQFDCSPEQEPYQFASTVKKYCKKRFDLGTLNGSGYCFFIYIPLTDEDIFDEFPKKLSFPMLKQNFTIQLNNKIWTVNPFSYTKTPIFYLAPA
jgi:hypothetical protein